MPNRYAILTFFATLILLLAASGCGGKGVEPTTTPEPPDSEPVTDARTARGADDDDTTNVDDGWDRDDTTTEDIAVDPYEGADLLLTIYFAFDSYELDETSLSNLAENATWIRAHPEATVVVEGHCDERGTIEYNLALGERRANSVRDYLESLGVDRAQVRITTYGEERPAREGHNEAAWSRNRRAEFVVDR